MKPSLPFGGSTDVVVVVWALIVVICVLEAVAEVVVEAKVVKTLVVDASDTAAVEICKWRNNAK